MNTTQLECCIECDSVLKQYVIGVFPSDRLPEWALPKSYGIIVNTDPANQPGQHWCAIYCDAQGHLEFFDSYGRSPERNSMFITTWIHRRSNHVRFNQKQLQSDRSSVCGQYCLLFLHQRRQGITLRQFLDTFDSSNFDTNDAYVTSVVSTMYPDCVSNMCLFNQTCKPRL